MDDTLANTLADAAHFPRRVQVSAASNDSEKTKTKPLLVHLEANTKEEELASRNGYFGHLTEVTLDPKAPVISRALDPAVLEHYRRLRTKILQEQAAKMFRTLVITSPNPQEGKTITVLNLGLSLAMLPALKVLIVDGDMRRGSLAKCLGVEGRPGLSNFIEGSSRLEDVVLVSPDLPIHFMGRGTSKTPAAELLQTCDLKTKFQEMAEPFSLVLIDSPPANLIADVQLLAANSDAVLLIARAFRTTTRAFEKAVRDVSQFRIIGTILNGGARAVSYYKYRNYY